MIAVRLLLPPPRPTLRRSCVLTARLYSHCMRVLCMHCSRLCCGPCAVGWPVRIRCCVPDCALLLRCRAHAPLLTPAPAPTTTRLLM